MKAIVRRGKSYFLNSSVHGLRYIAEPNRHFTERIFWIGVCLLAGVATYQTLLAAWYNFQHNAVNFGVETSYLTWNTTFPSITICESEAPDKIFDSSTKLYGEKRNKNLDFFVRDIAFFDGACDSCLNHCGQTINCTDSFDKIVAEVRADCVDLLDDCSWNGAPFNCCLHFKPLETEMGLCYSLNSMHASSVEPILNQLDELRLESNRETGPGKLQLSVFEATKLFIHSSDSVPTLNHPQEEKVTLNWGVMLDMVVNVVEIENDEQLGEVSVEQRHCYYPEEKRLQSYNFYSYSACVVDCRAAASAALCNCTHHLMPKIQSARTCDIVGLGCLSKHSETLRTLKSKGSTKIGLACDCISSCVEPEYTVVSKNAELNDLLEGTRISIAMDSLPRIRFKRNVVRTKLDLIVSMGGAAGLFIGASLLSSVEWIYYTLIRT